MKTHEPLQCSAFDNNSITIRPASSEDATIVSAITDAAYSKYIQRLKRKPEPMTVDYADIINKHSVNLLIFKDLAVGVLVLKHKEGQTLIWSVAVHPAYQGMGLGLRLLEHAEHEALRRGHKSIRLYTNSLFVENLSLYKWLGYAEARREQFLGSTLVHMTKNLENISCKERI